MRAWVVREPGPIDHHPLAEGDLPQCGRDVVPGHEVVGFVDQLGDGATR